ncbi:helix-turn-helix domain-containing protein [Saccharopolyspora sp. K220]|uniref:helix-turn-helix domain-containing protein n=1 Tax=Saccharopolyspora soli TaxID=2926618 RepID=UPI001F5A30B6|nr:helix-turn-helix transcriptional regulator [Saccharopolyspora soli]MCI2418686.1 helix-turn-helix domain-containing protein [Saccharopolyspora soli]
MTASSPPVARLQLGQLLRELREKSGKTQDAAAEVLECQKPKISKIETGKATISAGDVRLLIDLYGANAKTSKTVIQLAREARKRSPLRVPDWAQRYVALESIASAIQSYETELVPGLMQTEEYTRAAAQAAAPVQGSADPEQMVAVRAERRARLHNDKSMRFSAVVNEAVLRRCVGGPDVMADQLRHLRELAELPNITFQVIPFSTGAHAAMGASFHFLEIRKPASAKVVYLDGLTSGDYLDGAAAVSQYSLIFERLRSTATDETGSLDMLEQVIRDLA